MGRAVVLALTLALLLPAASWAETRRFDFEVLRNGRPIGSHVVVVDKREGETVVQVVVDLAVTFGPFTLYRYKHRSAEHWRDGRLATIEAETDDDGARLWARGWAENGKLVLDGPAGRQVGSTETLPSSYWNPGLRTATAWLETHWGTISPVKVTRRPPVALRLPGRTIQAIPYSFVSAKSDVAPLYTEEGEWVDLTFDLWAGRFDYVPRAATP